jgi:protein-disulfide isomerase
MSEELTPTHTTTTPKEKVEFKDLLIPLSIVLAGLFVGTGLYFGGAQVPTAMVAQDGRPDAPTGNTEKVDPVTDKDYVKGNRSAPVKIVEYSDFECPFCKQHHQTLQAVTNKLGEENIAWVYRQFPLEQLHPVKARAAAMASECVGSLGGNEAFWTFTDRYFIEAPANNRTDIETLIPKLVKETGVNETAFTTCFEGNAHEADIEADIADAVETGGRGTPWSIIIGPTGKTYSVNGAQSAAAIEQTIQLALKEGK